MSRSDVDRADDWRRFEGWLIESVRYFRELGFFAAYGSQSDEQVAATLLARYKERPSFLSPLDVMHDVPLLAYDTARIWWDDLEANLYNGGNVYQKTLLEWAAISRGTFSPENIRESWAGDEGPIVLTFTHKHQEVRLHPQFLGDWLDLSILAKINELICDSGLGFALYEAFDQSAWIVVLTEQERHRLTTERGWHIAML